MSNTGKLRDMNPTRALAYCATITATEWSTLDDDLTMDLWTVFRSYVLNGYKDDHIGIPGRIVEVWERCKTIIDREVGK